MNDFRKALDAHAAGQLELNQVEKELNLTLARQPQLAAAHGALSVVGSLQKPANQSDPPPAGCLVAVGSGGV